MLIVRPAGPLVMPPMMGALLADQATFLEGMRTSLSIAAAVALAAAAGGLLLPPARRSDR